MVSEVSAQEIAIALGARRDGDGWMARCPAHEDKTPSFSIGTGDGGKVLVHCFAGCEQERVLSALRRRGLWNEAREKYAYHPKPTPVRLAPTATDDDEKRRNFEWTQRRYAKAGPIATVGKTYFQSRGILGPLPDCLREENYPPCIIAPFTDISTNEVRGYHCTWLKPDGSGKADIPVPRKIYGKYGGCAIKLTEDAEVTYGLAVAEGVETALSVRDAGFPCWALGSAGNLAKFPVLDGIEALTIFADNDESGTGLKAARECAARWNTAGVEVRIVMPKQQGHDFNDALNVARFRHG